MAAAALASATRSSWWAVSSTALASAKATLAMMSSMESLGVDVGAAAAARARLGRLLGERQSQLGVARQPQAPAEAQHRRLRGARRRRQPADRQARRAPRVGEHDLGDALLRRCQRRTDPAQPHEHRGAQRQPAGAAAPSAVLDMRLRYGATVRRSEHPPVGRERLRRLLAVEQHAARSVDEHVVDDDAPAEVAAVGRVPPAQLLGAAGQVGARLDPAPVARPGDDAVGGRRPRRGR